MNFSDASKVQSVIQSCDRIARERSANRAKINAFANGNPPLSPADAAKMGLKIIFNDGSMAELFQQARRQYNNAFMSRSGYFKVKLPDAPEKYKLDWETHITRYINRCLKKSKAYFDVQRCKWMSLVSHGIAPTVRHGDGWCPRYVALEDFRVPTGTDCSLEDLPWFAVRESYTSGKLARAAFGKYADEGWKKEIVQKILKVLGQTNTQDGTANLGDNPEKAVELLKENGGYYDSDSAPKIWLWRFCFYDDTDPQDCKWKLRVVVDQNNSSAVSSNTDQFLFDDGDTAVAEDLSEILHVQFGDLSNVAPPKFWAVRSLGFLLMEPCFWDNIATCRLVQHVMENMNAWLRINNPVGKDRAQLVELLNQGILKEGVSVVPQSERHQINSQNLEIMQGRLKTLKDAASVTYTQDIQGKQSPDETATAVMARVSSVNAMMSGLLLTAFTYENFDYAEICRRFTKRGTTDKDCRKFQEAMRLKGIPAEWIDSSRWETEPEIPIGNGNPTMEMAKVGQLMQSRTAFSPEGQQWIKHQFATTLTDDPNAAETLAPLNTAPKMTNAEQFAEIAFGVLMQGVPIRGRDELNPQEQAEVLIGLLAGKIANIESTSNMATPSELSGLMMTAQFIESLIQRLQTDPVQAEVARMLAGKLGQLTNMIKAFGQRAAEAAQQQNGQNGNGEAAAKIQAMMATADTKNRIDEAKNAQRLHHKEAAFIGDQQRKDDSTIAETERQKLKTAAEIATAMAKAAAEPKPEPPVASSG